MEEHGTPFVSLSIRAFVDPNDPDDVCEVNALQDAVELNAGSEGPYFEANPYNSFGLNSITATPDERGRVTLNLAPEPGDLTNHAYIMDGWNYVLRLYKPQAPVLDKTWTPPTPQPAD